MTRAFIHDDFLLGTKAARALYHGYAEKEPILDFHNHLSPGQIAGNHQFADLAEAWLGGDHYKWRAMRTHGIGEHRITGNATAKEKFLAWAETVPYTLRNPLYHWTHLELKRVFGIEERLDSKSAESIWERANAQLPNLRVHDLLKKHEVRALCTTDDPADALDAHEAIRASGLATRVYPTFRPDKAHTLGDAKVYNAWIEKLEQTAGTTIRTLDDLLASLKKRHDAFHDFGCRISDHGLEAVPPVGGARPVVEKVFADACRGEAVTALGQALFTGFLVQEFGRWNAARGWTMQIHFGAQRNNNRRLLAALGPDTGFDSISDAPQARNLSTLLDSLDATNELPRMILYNLNPADNYLVGTMIGNFQDGTVPGKIQMGSGWWFLDQKEGMEWQLNALSSLGLLRQFVGMVTDSRSFLSFPRHEYFRRVLCNLLGRDMESGALPDDPELIGAMVREICFSNARDYLRLELNPL